MIHEEKATYMIRVRVHMKSTVAALFSIRVHVSDMSLTHSVLVILSC